MIALKLACLIMAVVNLVQRIHIRKLREENQAIRYAMGRVIQRIVREGRDEREELTVKLEQTIGRRKSA